MCCHRRLFILDRMKVVAFLVFVVCFNVAASTRNLTITTKGPLCGKGDASPCSCQCRSKENSGCDDDSYLVSGPWRVPDEQITASSVLNVGIKQTYGTDNSRLHSVRYVDSSGRVHTGSWLAGQGTTIHEYIQVELMFNFRVTGVATQGRNLYNGCCYMWVTKYLLLYSMDGSHWQHVTDTNGNIEEFIGNSDTNTVVTNMVQIPFMAKYVRINPREWNKYGALRFDLLGCRA